MELCEHYLHYMSALCEGTMPAPPELALTADTTEERAAQLQSALKDLSVPDRRGRTGGSRGKAARSRKYP